jgi:hypothetical protein
VQKSRLTFKRINKLALAKLKDDPEWTHVFVHLCFEELRDYMMRVIDCLPVCFD